MKVLDFSSSEIASYYRTRFPDPKQTGPEWRGACAVHQGSDANFAVNPDNGLAYCHSQCGRGWNIPQLEHELSGREWRECRQERLQEVATYDYHDAKGEFFQVVRYEPKTFRQRRGWSN